MFIKSVRVVNFRSLVDVQVDLTGYTALVGLNDAGKSNVLRALNLFYNGETDLGEPLVFDRDFSQNAKVGVKKAKQIEIEVELQPPLNYKNSAPIIWRKHYRAGPAGPHLDLIARKDGVAFSPNSRTGYWARSLAFEYVPAVRGRPFFNALKRRLHATLAATVAPKLTHASGAFLAGLRAEVVKIEQESHRLLDLRTEFSLPSDLGDLFEALEFNSSDADNVLTALHYRGDGVQGRHVPLILKFLADQRKKNSAKGRPPSETIWGFEEPENNLELAKQIDVAKEFEDYSRDLQIIVSTHSPAFYKAAKNSGVGSIQFASRKGGLTAYDPEPLSETVDGSLGLMPFVEPYLDEAERQRDAVLKSLADMKADGLINRGNALYVEGDSDKVMIEAALAALKLNLGAEIYTKKGPGGGALWVADSCIARAALTDVQGKTVGLFDDDDAGRSAKAHLSSICGALGRVGAVQYEFVGVKNDVDHVRAIKKSGVKISWSIEELCHEFVWRHADERGWLEPRHDELLRLNVGILSADKTLLHVVDERIAGDFERLVVTKTVRLHKKKEFSDLAADLMAVDGVVPASFRTLIVELCGKFK